MALLASPARDTSTRPKLFVSMALEDIREVMAALSALEIEYETEKAKLIAERDEYLLDALHNRVAVAELGNISGMSRAKLYRLRDRAYPGMS